MTSCWNHARKIELHLHIEIAIHAHIVIAGLPATKKRSKGSDKKPGFDIYKTGQFCWNVRRAHSQNAMANNNSNIDSCRHSIELAQEMIGNPGKPLHLQQSREVLVSVEFHVSPL
jgi:hypothetical protein